jgi:hypothetical protein
MGRNGLERLDEIWYQTWVFDVNLSIEGDLGETPIRTIIGQAMKVERLVTGRGQLDELTRHVLLELRNKIPWLEDGQAEKESPEGCRYFGKWFELKIGRHTI